MNSGGTVVQEYYGSYSGDVTGGVSWFGSFSSYQWKFRMFCCTPKPSGMVGWFPLDEETGPHALEIVNGFNGEHVNNPTPVAGMVGNGLELDGKQYVEVHNPHPDFYFGTGDFSVDAWIWTTQSSGVVTVIDHRCQTGGVWGYSVYMYNGKLGFQLADGAHSNWNSSAFVADGLPHMIAITVDRDNEKGGKMYVDGQEVYTFNPTNRSGSINHDFPFRIGSHSSSVSYLFKGIVDEVELFNCVVPASGIQAIYQAGAAGKCK